MPPASASPVASIVEGRACEPGGMLRDVAATPQSRLPVRRISADDTVDFPDTEWPRSLPVIAQVLREGIDLGAITVLVGENGSGKSTLVEAIALAYGMSPEGGSTGARHTSRQTESAVWKSLVLSRDIGSSRWGFFLRAETMHGFFSYLEQNPGGPEAVFHELSHGESFLEIFSSRFNGPGLYMLDEPESALSFSGCLALVQLLRQIAARGDAQAIIATHSPILAAVPGARIFEIGDWGLRETPWNELALVQNWSSFLQDPQRYLRHLID